MEQQDVNVTRNDTCWNAYDTRHTVFRPRRLTAESLEAGYWHAYQEFYCWKKLEPMWDWVIRAKRVANLLPVLEAVLAGFRLKSGNAAPGSPSFSPDPNDLKTDQA